MSVPVNKFKTSSQSWSEDGKTAKTKFDLGVSQWDTFDLSAPSLYTTSTGTGWDASGFVKDLKQLQQLRDTLIKACDEHEAAICTSDDPTDHQGNTCPVHEAATAISEGVTG